MATAEDAELRQELANWLQHSMVLVLQVIHADAVRLATGQVCVCVCVRVFSFCWSGRMLCAVCRLLLPLLTPSTAGGLAFGVL